jgi:peptidoglycan LD-endopeptidase CwlK
LIVSRDVDDLAPDTRLKARAFLAACAAEGIDILVTCTLRDVYAQAKLYASGRTAPGPILTNAKPGQSLHNDGRAIDVVPMFKGKPLWDTNNKDNRAIWMRVGELGEQAGLQWAGRWTGKLREYCHFESKR